MTVEPAIAARVPDARPHRRSSSPRLRRRRRRARLRLPRRHLRQPGLARAHGPRARRVGDAQRRSLGPGSRSTARSWTATPTATRRRSRASSSSRSTGSGTSFAAAVRAEGGPQGTRPPGRRRRRRGPVRRLRALLERRAARWTRGREAVLLALWPRSGRRSSATARCISGTRSPARSSSSRTTRRRVSARAPRAGSSPGWRCSPSSRLAIGGVIVGAYLLSRPLAPKLVLAYALGGAPVRARAGAYHMAITGSPFDSAVPSSRERVLHRRTRTCSTFTRSSSPVASSSASTAGSSSTRRRCSCWRRWRWRIETLPRRLLLGAFALAQLGFIASFWMWDGGWCIGPRHLAPLMMVLLYEGVDAVARTPRATLPLPRARDRGRRHQPHRRRDESIRPFREAVHGAVLASVRQGGDYTGQRLPHDEHGPGQVEPRPPGALSSSSRS